MPRSIYDTPALLRLAERLSRGRPLTARDVARSFRCSVVTAHRRLARLRLAGYALRVTRVRQGRSGPLSAAYEVADETVATQRGRG